jgi:hypothetical protein
MIEKINIPMTLTHDHEGWFAEWNDGKNPLHFAEGQTKDECLVNFFSSLDSTMKLHMQTYGHIEGITKFMK